MVFLSFNYYYIPLIAVAFAGLSNIIYLFTSHYRVYTDINYESFCAISRAINCDTVSQSSYSIFLGMPLAVWGIMGNLFVIYILLLAGSQSAKKQRMWPLLFWVALGFSLYSLYLGYISTYYIQSYCLMCILGYLVNFALLYYAWFINRRFGNTDLLRGLASDIRFLKDHWKSASPVIILLLLFSVTGPFWFPEYWHLKGPAPSHAMPAGITEEGHPWIGAEDPVLIIAEFSDYMCFQCRKMHYYIRRLIEANPGKIRLVHRNFPMDHQYNPLVREPYHVGAGQLALMAIHAKDQDKFWEANDYFYTLGAQRESFTTLDVSEKLELANTGLVMALRNEHYFARLFDDIRTGLELGITATPSYLIDGKLYEGQIPAHIFSEVLK